MNRLLPCTALLIAALCVQTAGARCLTTISVGDDVRSKMDTAASTGCSVYFEPGAHTVPSARLGFVLTGTANDPIEIYGDSAATTSLTRPNATQNLFDLSGAYFIVHDLELVGGSRGVRLDGPTSNATFTRLVIHGTADAAFTANQAGQTFTGLTISHTEIYGTDGTGECMYLGCNNDTCTFGESIIEFNYCHDTNSSGGTTQGDGLDLKGGSYGVIVRHNVFKNVYGPGILSYANGGKAQNVIEGNVVWNSGDVGIQVTGDAVIRNNVIILDGADTGVDALNCSAANQGVPDNLQIINNTVVKVTNDQGGGCFAARGWGESAENMVIANNALYCPGGEALYLQTGYEFALVTQNAIQGSANVPGGTFPGGSYLEQLESIADANAYPLSDSLLLDAASAAQLPDDEFNGFVRESADVGAYEFVGSGNPGWTGSDTFKILVPEPDARWSMAAALASLLVLAVRRGRFHVRSPHRTA